MTLPLLPNSIAAMADELTEWRRDLHRHPELGYEETRTASVVAERLEAFGFDRVETGIGVTGVIGVLHGRGGAATCEEEAILLRADMDALPIMEDTHAPYASLSPGTMHACGHDGHMTMLLGAAKHLAETRNFKGTIYFCFQPAEEGGAGAKAMIEDGLFDRFPCRAVYGMHNWPGLPIGSFATRPGPMLAASDKFRITLTGRGGHAAKPDKARDPLVAGAYLVTVMQTLVSRVVDPLQPAVVSICAFHAGEAFNVIPETAELLGTVRSFDEGVHDQIYEAMARQVREVGTTFDLKAELRHGEAGYPPTLNDPAQTAFAIDVLTELAGAERVKLDQPPTMGGEDFSFLAREKPGCFVFIGNGESASLHHPKYDFNDEATPLGVAYWSLLAERALPL